MFYAFSMWNVCKTDILLQCSQNLRMSQGCPAGTT